MLWVDEMRPKVFDTMDYHFETNNLLSNIAAKDDFPHLLLYGPTGAGKKTRVLALLQKIFGDGVEKSKVESRSLKAHDKATPIDIEVIQSQYHLEVCPSDVGNKDTVIVQTLIKDLAQSQTVTNKKFRVLVIDDAELLSHQAQAGLRRTMEKYVQNCRIIMLCSTLSKIIPPLRSRCVCIRVPAPTNAEVVTCLQKVATKKQVQAPAGMFEKIAVAANRDLRRAILLFETSFVGGFTEELVLNAWEQYCNSICDTMTREQSPKALLQIRGQLYELLTSCIPGDVILKSFVSRLSQILKGHEDMLQRLVHTASHYDRQLRIGNKEIYHLEAFCARFMADYKAWAIRQQS